MVTFKNNKKNIIIAAIVAILFVLGYAVIYLSHRRGTIFQNKLYFLIASLCWIILAALFCFRFLYAKAFLEIKKISLNIIYILILPAVTFLMGEILYNKEWKTISYKGIIIDYFIILLFTLLLTLIIRIPWISYIAILTFNLIYGIINHYTLTFKGCPPLFGDILGIKTGMAVMTNYTYTLADNLIAGMLIYLAALFCVICIKPVRRISVKGIRNNLIYIICMVCVFVGIVSYAGNGDIKTTFDLAVNNYTPLGTFFYNGAPTTMLISIQNSKMRKPNNYSEEEVKKMVEGASKVQSANKVTPNIIVIMNESFSDLRVLGEFESDEFLSNFYGIDDYVMRGNTYVSVRGGSTCNSEFEFLTGSSMANLTSGISPYQSFAMKNSFSVVGILQNEGYETNAFHPFNAENWNRIKVYKDLDFNNYYSIRDMDYSEVKFVSWAASDETDFDKVIEISENSAKPYFIFNVTMQNHASYDAEPILDDFVKIEDKYSDCASLIHYLSLIRETDIQFKRLIEYYSQVEEPTLICMFGDHQPSAVEDKFIEGVTDTSESETEQLERQYNTPYIIWANYDTGIEQNCKDISLNYLGAYVLNIAGIESKYSDYLINLSNELPIINSVGYMTSDNKWHSIEEASDLIEKYKWVQYYELLKGNSY